MRSACAAAATATIWRSFASGRAWASTASLDACMGLVSSVSFRQRTHDRCQEVSSADCSALLNDVLRNILRRSGNELVVAQREPSGGRRRVGHVRIEAIVLGEKALQATGDGLRIEAG